MGRVYVYVPRGSSSSSGTAGGVAPGLAPASVAVLALLLVPELAVPGLVPALATARVLPLLVAAAPPSGFDDLPPDLRAPLGAPEEGPLGCTAVAIASSYPFSQTRASAVGVPSAPSAIGAFRPVAYSLLNASQMFVFQHERVPTARSTNCVDYCPWAWTIPATTSIIINTNEATPYRLASPSGGL